MHGITAIAARPAPPLSQAARSNMPSNQSDSGFRPDVLANLLGSVTALRGSLPTVSSSLAAQMVLLLLQETQDPNRPLSRGGGGVGNYGVRPPPEPETEEAARGKEGRLSSRRRRAARALESAAASEPSEGGEQGEPLPDDAGEDALERKAG